ncbi:hypothetical protein NLG97_g4389 [Lecanicillium saksenae]|uniref:Uncharacterized protein n=1 Tax=Lecanicillium saksenae TaxID=468837 RepID=A0ACC1QX53_9HYPO|nr:hypothetical protein NLG97_g4389 [Lecanicillium saksenae]
MDLLSVCESLASNIIKLDTTESPGSQINELDIEHWQLCFKFTRAGAVEEISSWRADFSRQTVSQDAWEAIKDSEFAKDFSKETYEYFMARGRTLEHRTAPVDNDTSIYLLRIHETSPSVRMVQDLLGDDNIQVLPGIDDDGNRVQFCSLDANKRNLLLSKLASSASAQFQPTFIRVSIAKKDLDINSRYPTLGIKSTLPQHRADSNADCFEPAQNEYPVRYFFYGTLADRAVLARVLGIVNEESIRYDKAEVHGAILTSWAGKYKGLVDGDQGAKVSGAMYWVSCHQEEEALRIYETGKYEVVRCTMRLQSNLELCNGLTFRLI